MVIVCRDPKPRRGAFQTALFLAGSASWRKRASTGQDCDRPVPLLPSTSVARPPLFPHMTKLTRALLLSFVLLVAAMAYGGVPPMNVTVSDAGGKAAFKG